MSPQIANSLQERLAEPVSSSIRFLNFLIDLAFWGIILIVLDFFIPLTQTGNNGIFNYSLLSISFLIYYFTMEVNFHRTIGKFITRTKVVTENGQEPTFPQILLRTLCRLIPLDQFSFIIVRKGFHDYLSKTMVVDETAVTITE